MTTQEIVDIASRYDNKVADEMLRACAIWSYENGVPISIPKGRMSRAESRRTEDE